jgi:hypothetical protein
MNRRGLPPGRFRYESGSYGGPGQGYMPSIICYKELKSNSWKEHFCLVKPDVILNDENTASSIAKKHLAAAQAIIAAGGGPQDFALKLRHEGYKNVTDFRVVNE